MQTAARKHAVDMVTSRRTEAPKGGRGPRSTVGRLRHADAAPPPTNGSAAPRRFRRRPHRLACNIPGSGRGEARGAPRHKEHGSLDSHRAPPHRGPRAAPPGTKPVGSAVARFRLGTHGFETLRIDTSRTRVRGEGETPPSSLIASTPERELTGNGAPARDTTRRLSSPTRLHGHPERAESHETRKRPENGQAHRRGVAKALARGGDCFPTSQEGCGDHTPHLTLPSLRGPLRSRLNRAPLPL